MVISPEFLLARRGNTPLAERVSLTGATVWSPKRHLLIKLIECNTVESLLSLVSFSLDLVHLHEAYSRSRSLRFEDLMDISLQRSHSNNVILVALRSILYYVALVPLSIQIRLKQAADARVTLYPLLISNLLTLILTVILALKPLRNESLWSSRPFSKILPLNGYPLKGAHASLSELPPDSKQFRGHILLPLFLEDFVFRLARTLCVLLLWMPVPGEVNWGFVFVINSGCEGLHSWIHCLSDSSLHYLCFMSRGLQYLILFWEVFLPLNNENWWGNV